MVTKRLVFLIALSLVTALITGCLGGGQTGSYTLNGSVVEAGTGNPISGAEVAIDSKAVASDSAGNFVVKLGAGTYTLKVNAPGYAPYEASIHINGDTTTQAELTTTGPVVHVEALQDITDGQVLEDAKVTIAGNINDILSVRGDVASLNTAITITQLQAIVNGVTYEIEVEEDGSFEQEVPLDPGSNTIQLRVFDADGNAGTSSILRVTVSLPRIDLRVILSWDTSHTDVDLHMFQRNASEGNVPASYDDWRNLDRHVWWPNKLPDDFGTTPDSNPILDIDDMDGYGPETILLREAAPGHYHIWVHFFSGPSNPPTNATVRIVVNGGTDDAKVYERSQTLDEEWEVWYVGTIEMHSGRLIQVSPQQ